jgi:3-methylcrotonyl-CoA carboxylase alpha subunit
MTRTLTSVLIANRGEIACRILRTARRLGMRTVAVYSEADRTALHVALADEAYPIGPAPATDSYLRIDRIVETALRAGADCIHPGYGFLSEHPGLAEACAKAGIVFVGPPAAAIRAMGLKHRAKALVAAAGVPVVPGYLGEEQGSDRLRAEADSVGYPLLIKAVAGGGGKGIRRVAAPAAFTEALESARREAESAFGDAQVLLERYVPNPRHIEVQVFCDAQGGAVHLFERDCSLQRRHQKVIEEAPAPGMTSAVRAAMGQAALNAARAVGYVGAGTVEFIAAGDQALTPESFWFMEMNTRLQVEHPVTEAITGVDLVAWQFRVAAGEPLPASQDEVRIDGHAIEARLYAEDPAAGFLPSTGRLHALRLPEAVRVDTGLRAGDIVGLHYDPLIAKLIAHGPTRAVAIARLRQALDATLVAGPRTNLAFLRRLTASEAVQTGQYDTALIERQRDTLAERPSDVEPACIGLGVLAMLGFDQQSPVGRTVSPWDIADGFQLAAPRRQPWPLRIDGRRDEVTLVWPDPGASGPPEVRYRGQACPTRATVDRAIEAIPTGDGILVLHEGHQISLQPPDPADAACAQAEQAGDITAPMHGRIVAVHVAPGDRVARGQRLGIIEAMKMEHALTAPADGAVVAVTAEPGQQVAEGASLFTLTQEESE